METKIAFTQENFNDLIKHNMDMSTVLKGIVNGCVHPNVAVRAVMVDLKPIRAILKRNKEFYVKLYEKNTPRFSG